MTRGVATSGGDLPALRGEATPGLVERDGVIGAVGRLLASAAAGGGGALLVVGEAGLGKTAVCRRAMGMAAGTFRLGVGRGDPVEAGVAFGVVSQALHRLGVPDPLQAGAARGAAMDVRAARLAGVRAALGGAGRPTLVVLEDLHWADPDSLAAVSYLCRRLPGSSLAVVATLRPWPGEAAAVAARLAEEPRVTLVRLTPLSEEATGGLLRARLGSGTGAEAVGRTWRLTGGNPLLLEQMVLARAQGAPLSDLEGPMAPVVDATLLARFAGLSRDGHRCARAAAVLGTTFADADAVSVAGLDQAGAESAVDELLATGLVVPGEAEGTLAFVHPLFASGVYRALAPARRARLHRRAFALLAGRGDVQAAADHALLGGPDLGRGEARVLEEAGRLAWQAGAP
ncbi:MAG TPA: AAA family ATPase, partial [Acidimicrobiales bacterium]|nr:AAA family ATPase [Acidimicrobiales bacterium]